MKLAPSKLDAMSIYLKASSEDPEEVFACAPRGSCSSDSTTGKSAHLGAPRAKLVICMMGTVGTLASRFLGRFKSATKLERKPERKPERLSAIG